jgi:hypothetical protein
MSECRELEIEQAGKRVRVEAAVEHLPRPAGGMSTIAFRIPRGDTASWFDDDALFDVVGAEGGRSKFVVLRKVGRERLAVGTSGTVARAA